MTPQCPHARKIGGYCKEADEYFFDVLCDLVDKYCLVEYGNSCSTYDEWLKEETNGH